MSHLIKTYAVCKFGYVRLSYLLRLLVPKNHMRFSEREHFTSMMSSFFPLDKLQSWKDFTERNT